MIKDDKSIEIIEDDKWYCVCCSSRSKYRVDFRDNGYSLEQDLYLCEEHKVELLDLLLPF